MDQLRAAVVNLLSRHRAEQEPPVRDPELLHLAERVHKDEEAAHENLQRINAVAAFVGIQDIDWWRAQHEAAQGDER